MMKHQVGFKLLLVFYSSLFLNVFFIAFLFLSTKPLREFLWTRRAAEEAEAAAAIACSGHGRAFVDGVRADGRPACECNRCYGGSDCSVPLPNCAADANSGDPLFLEPYWLRHAAGSAVVVAGWHRMSYETNGDNSMSVELERHIRILHRLVGNAVTDDRFIVFGAGSTQLLNALVYALSADNSSSPASVVASAPYYALYREQTQTFNSKQAQWKGVTSAWTNAANQSTTENNFIEFVTSPNNPDGGMNRPVLNGSSVIYDHAYYWPHFTPITAPANGDVMVFSTSKLSGHAGSRFGWALIKDEKVYNKTVYNLGMNTMGVSRDTQLRMLNIYKVILAQHGVEKGGIFRFGSNTMEERWLGLKKVLSKSNRFSLQKLSPQYCNYFKAFREPSPAYAWLKCELEEDTDCYAVLKAAGINGRSGTVFEGDSRHVRLSLVRSQDDFDQLLRKLRALVLNNEAIVSSM